MAAAARPLPDLTCAASSIDMYCTLQRVVPQAGFAYVSKDQMSSLVVQPFRWVDGVGAGSQGLSCNG
jgi:hypothetical protein